MGRIQQRTAWVEEPERTQRSNRDRCPECGGPLRSRSGSDYCWVCEKDITWETVKSEVSKEVSDTISATNMPSGKPGRARPKLVIEEIEDPDDDIGPPEMDLDMEGDISDREATIPEAEPVDPDEDDEVQYRTDDDPTFELEEEEDRIDDEGDSAGDGQGEEGTEAENGVEADWGEEDAEEEDEIEGTTAEEDEETGEDVVFDDDWEEE